MITKRPGVLVLAAGLALSALSSSAAAQSTYIGPSQGLWSDPANWSPFGVPDNSLGGSFNVILPASSSVMFDLTTPTQITGASFGTNSSIDIPSSSLEILGIAVLDDLHIQASGSGSAFITNAPLTSGFQQTVHASDGAYVQLGLSSYTFLHRVGNTLIADGVDSLIDLSTATLVNGSSAITGGGSFTSDIQSRNNGQIDFSGISIIQGAGSDDWVRFISSSDGLIDLSGVNEITSGRTWFWKDGGSIDLSSLSLIQGNSISTSTKFEIEPANSLSLPLLSTAVSTYFNIHDGGTVDAPMLTNILGSIVTVSPLRTLNTPLLTEIDNARLHVIDGAIFEIGDTDYNVSGLSNQTLLSSDGLNSLLDLSSVESIDASGSFTGGGTYFADIVATNSGSIDLSGVTSLHGAGSDDVLRFVAASGGTIDLSNIAKATLGRSYFEMEGGTIDLAMLNAADQSRFEVGTFQTMNLPNLAAAQSTIFDMAPGGAIVAPLLTDIYNSRVTISSTTFFIAPAFTQIDNASINVIEGAELSVADDDLNFTLSNRTIMTASDNGSLLDLSSVDTIDAIGAVTGGGTYTLTVASQNNGTVNLSGANEIVGAGSDDWFRLFSSGGGSILLGDPSHNSGRLWLDVQGLGSSIHVSGDLNLGIFGGTSRISVSSSGEIQVAGDLIHKITSESRHATSAGILHMNGMTGMQTLEVAGANIGIPVGIIPDNFNWGAMEVGQDTQPTTVSLIDTIDNGNRGPGGESEMLYLSGFPASNALRILGGSTLVLNGIQVYAFQNNQWIDINALFGPGQYKIPYDDGFIQLFDCVADVNGDGTLNSADFTAWIAAFNAAAPGCDQNGDGSCTAADFTAWIANFNAGCS